VEVELNSKYGEGKYLFGLVDSLPDDSFDALIGNDLGPPVFGDDSTCIGVVTRSQTKALQQPSSSVPTVSDQDSGRLHTPTVSGDKPKDDDDIAKAVLDSTDGLIKLQHDDSTLSHLFQLVQDKSLVLILMIYRYSFWKKVFSCVLGVIKSCLLFQELRSYRLSYLGL